MSFPFRYELGATGVEVKLGPWTVRKIAYWDIEAVSEGYAWFNEHWTNIWPLRFLTLRRKTGWFKNFLINPSDRAGFAAELRRRMGGK